MKRLLQLRWTYLYLLLVPLVNWSFAAVPTVPMPDGGEWPPMAIVTGLVLVFRDFTQREIGHYVFIPLLIGVYLSYEMAGAEIALASGLAFLVSETVDWAVYTFTKKPLSARIMLSSLIGAPIDSAVFLLGASLVVSGIFTPFTIATSIASKLLGAYIVYRIIKHREQRGLVTA